MEILFIWLEKYRNFKEQGFNFSSEFIFDWGFKQKIFNLNIKKNPEFIDNFFDNKNIVNATAIIGQNGAGKTTILDFIKECLPDGSAGIPRNVVLILKKQEYGDTKYLIYYPESYSLETSKESKISLTKIAYPDLNKELFSKVSKYFPDFSENIFIHYSNVFDLRVENGNRGFRINGEQEPISVHQFYNISTVSHLSNDRTYYVNSERSKIDRLDAYKASELNRNIDLVCSPYRNKLDFKFPEFLYISIVNNDENLLFDEEGIDVTYDSTEEEEKEKKKEKETESSIKHLISYLQKFASIPIVIQKQSGWNQMFFSAFLRSAFYNFIRAHKQIVHKDFAKYLSGKNHDEAIINFFKKVKEIDSMPTVAEKASKILELYDHLKINVKKRIYKVMKDVPNCIVIPVKSKDKFTIEYFNLLYLNAKSLSEFIEFKWRNLSSGEQSMLTLFSRFYDLKNRLGKEGIINKNLTILIDEGDTYFHPDWQRKYVHLIFDTIPKFFPKNRIQFILTSNAPFIASDFPRSNIIFLKKLEKFSVEVVRNNDEMEQTFAANIHTLLSKSFFLESGLLGEFAKNKIEKIVKGIRGKDYENINNIKSIIEIIGEPLIKDRLNEMFEEEFGIDSPEEIEITIERLKKQLLETEEIKRKRDENRRKG